MCTDADCLDYGIESRDLYEDFYETKEMVAFGEYSQDPKFYDVTNKKIIFKMIDKTKPVPMVVFEELESRTYSFVKNNGVVDWNAKEIIKMLSIMKYFLISKNWVRNEKDTK